MIIHPPYPRLNNRTVARRSKRLLYRLERDRLGWCEEGFRGMEYSDSVILIDPDDLRAFFYEVQRIIRQLDLIVIRDIATMMDGRVGIEFANPTHARQFQARFLQLSHHSSERIVS